MLVSCGPTGIWHASNNEFSDIQIIAGASGNSGGLQDHYLLTQHVNVIVKLARIQWLLHMTYSRAKPWHKLTLMSWLLIRSSPVNHHGLSFVREIFEKHRPLYKYRIWITFVTGIMQFLHRKVWPVVNILSNLSKSIKFIHILCWLQYPKCIFWQEY